MSTLHNAPRALAGFYLSSLTREFHVNSTSFIFDSKFHTNHHAARATGHQVRERSDGSPGVSIPIAVADSFVAGRASSPKNLRIQVRGLGFWFFLFVSFGSKVQGLGHVSHCQYECPHVMFRNDRGSVSQDTVPDEFPCPL